MGGGSGGGGSTSSTSQTSNVPDYLKPYYMQVMGQASDLTNLSKNPYVAYPGQSVAGFDPMQEKAFKGINDMQVSPELNQAGGYATRAGDAAGRFMNDSSYQHVTNPTLQNYQMGAIPDVTTQDYTGANVDKYMSPYMQDVVNQQKMAAGQDYARSLPNMQANAGAMGALGGTRANLTNINNMRNLQQQLQGIQATGSQSAFENAQNQFNTQAARQMQADQGNQQTRYGVGSQNLNANLQTQALGSGQNMQAQLANQQAGLSTRQMQQAALDQGLNAGNLLNSIGQNRYAQNTGILSGQMNAGAMRQGQNQKIYDDSMARFNEQRNYPYQQLQFMSNLMHGTPMNSTQTMWGGQPNQMGQIASGMLGVASLPYLWGK